MKTNKRWLLPYLSFQVRKFLAQRVERIVLAGTPFDEAMDRVTTNLRPVAKIEKEGKELG